MTANKIDEMWSKMVDIREARNYIRRGIDADYFQSKLIDQFSSELIELTIILEAFFL